MTDRRAIVVNALGQYEEMPVGDTLAADQIPGGGGSLGFTERVKAGLQLHSGYSVDKDAGAVWTLSPANPNVLAYSTNSYYIEDGSEGSGLAIIANLSDMIRLSTGTTALGSGSVRTTNRVLGRLGRGYPWERSPIGFDVDTVMGAYSIVDFIVPTLSVAAQKFSTTFGFNAIASGATLTTGIRVTRDHDVNSGNWVVRYVDSAGAARAINTSAVPIPGVRCRIEVEATRDLSLVFSEEVRINGVVVATITDSNMNTGGNYIECRGDANLQKSIGTTARTMDLYFMMCSISFDDPLV